MSALLQDLQTGIYSHSTEETREIAYSLAGSIPADTILAFHGDLGAGKTTFIRGMARAWDITEPVTSPTYNLYAIYQGTRQLVHLDAYRLNTGSDLDTLMIDDFLSPPWCLAIEWPERIADSIPDHAWHLYLEIAPDQSHSIRLVTC